MGEQPLFKINSKMYQEFKDQPNFQNIADNHMGKLIAAQHKRYDTKFYGKETDQIRPSNLYQEYLKKSGILPGDGPEYQQSKLI